MSPEHRTSITPQSKTYLFIYGRGTAGRPSWSWEYAKIRQIDAAAKVDVF